MLPTVEQSPGGPRAASVKNMGTASTNIKYCMEKITLLATINQAGISMFIPTYSHLKQGRISFLVTIAVRLFVLRKLRMRALLIICILVACMPYLMNSARLHKVFQNFVVPWKIHIYKNLILSSDAS